MSLSGQRWTRQNSSFHPRKSQIATGSSVPMLCAQYVYMHEHDTVSQ